MRMGFLSSGIFWGAVVIIVGVSMLIKAVFNIDIPVLRVLFGLIVIWFGISLMTGWHGCKTANTVVFSECEVSAKDIKGDYSVVFGKGTLDLSGVDIKEKSVNAKIDTVFGDTYIIIDPHMPVKVQVDSAFASAIMPDKNMVSFGTMNYTSPAYKEGANCLYIKADVVFGSLRIVNK